jgi:hypothetical protein
VVLTPIEAILAGGLLTTCGAVIADKVKKWLGQDPCSTCGFTDAKGQIDYLVDVTDLLAEDKIPRMDLIRLRNKHNLTKE